MSDRTKSRGFDNYPMMLQAAVEGHGIAMGWRRTADRLVASGALIRPNQESLPLPDVLSIYIHNGDANRRETRALVQWLQDELQDD
nr:LysR substrate-binding domain-containing protein [Pseudomonas sp. LAMO17WK12:I10]